MQVVYILQVVVSDLWVSQVASSSCPFWEELGSANLVNTQF
jgi:hypothetical protein